MLLSSLGLLTLAGAATPPRTVWLDTLDLTKMTQRRGTPQANKALGGTPLTMNGTVHDRGIGTRSISEFVLDLHGEARRFRAIVGFDDSARQGKPDGTVRYQIWGDDRLLADTQVMRLGDAPRPIDIDVAGISVLTLRLDDGGDTSNGDIANWADARIELAPGATRDPAPHVRPAAPIPDIAMRDAETLRIAGLCCTGPRRADPSSIAFRQAAPARSLMPPRACPPASASTLRPA